MHIKAINFIGVQKILKKAKKEQKNLWFYIDLSKVNFLLKCVLKVHFYYKTNILGIVIESISLLNSFSSSQRSR